jgi:hypothetical protein
MGWGRRRSKRSAARPSTSVRVSFEGVQALGPVGPVGLDPRVHLGKRLGAQRVEAPLAVGPDVNEAGAAQHLEVLGNPGLAEIEAFDEVAHRPLAAAQQVEDLAAVGLGERCVRRHGPASYHQTVICSATRSCSRRARVPVRLASRTRAHPVRGQGLGPTSKSFTRQSERSTSARRCGPRAAER